MVCLGLLVPGVSQPIFELSADLKVNSQLANIQLRVMENSRSILTTVEQLWQEDRLLVAALIFLFSVAVPVVKSVLLLLGIFSANGRVRNMVQQTLQAIGKWSMADVFVVAIFLAFLATDESGALSQEMLNVMGMRIPIEAGVIMRPTLGPGFYWFLGYCLLSLATLHVADLRQTD